MTDTYDPSRSRSELVAAMPRINQLVDELRATVTPALDGEGIDGGAALEAVIIAAAVKALTHLSRDNDTADRIAGLLEVADAAAWMSTAAHNRIAEMADPDDIAHHERSRRTAARDTGGTVVTAARLHIELGEHATVVEVSAEDGGRITWAAVGSAPAPLASGAQQDAAQALHVLGAVAAHQLAAAPSAAG
jgi:hypothetical protein